MTPVRPTTVLLALLLAVATGCGSADDTAAPAVPAATTDAATAEATTAGATTAEAGATTEEAAAVTGEVDCSADEDADNLSGSASVLFTADTAATVSDSDVTPTTTLTYAEDGTLTPTTLSVAVGEAFGVTTPVGGGIHAAAVGCADAQTVAPGAVSGFQVLVPGTYPVVDEISGETVATVTVG